MLVQGRVLVTGLERLQWEDKKHMNTNELFELISALPEFKDYSTNYRVLKTRHKNGTLTNETYAKLFDYFGYIEIPNKWIKKK